MCDRSELDGIAVSQDDALQNILLLEQVATTIVPLFALRFGGLRLSGLHASSDLTAIVEAARERKSAAQLNALIRLRKTLKDGFMGMYA